MGTLNKQHCDITFNQQNVLTEHCKNQLHTSIEPACSIYQSIKYIYITFTALYNSNISVDAEILRKHTAPVSRTHLSC